MPVLRSIMALIGGFAIMAFLTIVLMVVAAWSLHLSVGARTESWFVANVVVSGLAALAGGYSAAALAPNRPRTHAIALAIMILAMSLSQFIQPPQSPLPLTQLSLPAQPRWYAGALTLISPLAAVLGGMLRRQRHPVPVST
jgi:hypothetical protein